MGAFCSGLGDATVDPSVIANLPPTTQAQKDVLLAFSDTAQQAFTNTARKLTQLGPPRITNGKQVQDIAVGSFTTAAKRFGDQRAKLAALDPNDPDLRQKASELLGLDIVTAQLQEVTSNPELVPAFLAAPECQQLPTELPEELAPTGLAPMQTGG